MPTERAIVYPGDCLELLKDIPSNSLQLVVTSPPYNIGKEYEKRVKLDSYLKQQKKVISECVRVLAPSGSICWQVGNFVDKGSIIPLDTALYPIFSGNWGNIHAIKYDVLYKLYTDVKANVAANIIFPLNIRDKMFEHLF